MPRADYAVSVKVQMPACFRPRMWAATILIHLAARLVGSPSVQVVRTKGRPGHAPLIPPRNETPSTGFQSEGDMGPGHQSADDDDAAMYRGTWLELRKCHQCRKPAEQLHQAAPGIDLCWPCFNRFLHKCEAEEARREEHRQKGPARPDKLDPANCHECGLPHGGSYVEGKVTRRPYHFDCMYPERRGV
ncbi:hypothetical protein P12x_003063 [Tundrisphaera lichenicola]|uniref:hypothetical protein n=1 Tax=Tundrisphaera lichenicola TaxID=2029860 RepID=UPI003EC09435